MLLLLSWLLLLGVRLVFWLVISTWSPPRSLVGSRLGSGLTWMLPGLMLKVSCLLLRVNVVGSQLVVVVEIFWLVARWLLLVCYPFLFLLAGGCSLIVLFLLRSIVIGGFAG